MRKIREQVTGNRLEQAEQNRMIRQQAIGQRPQEEGYRWQEIGYSRESKIGWFDEALRQNARALAQPGFAGDDKTFARHRGGKHMPAVTLKSLFYALL